MTSRMCVQRGFPKHPHAKCLRMRRSFLFTCVLVLASIALPGAAHAGAFSFASEGNGEDLIIHPIGYTGAGGTLTITVGIDPSSTFANQMRVSVRNVLRTINLLTPTTGNLVTGEDNNVPENKVDFESVVLHELGHALGLAHPNLAGDTGLSGDDTEYTRATDGPNNTEELNMGSDALRGSGDDIRGDDGNLHYFNVGLNDPFVLGDTVDLSTYSRNVADLPQGDSFPANAERNVADLMGYADTEAVMQQGTTLDEAQRTLCADDVATIRLAMAGLDGTQGTPDDYRIVLEYAGLTTSADMVVSFDNSRTVFAVTFTTASFLAQNHFALLTGDLYFNDVHDWFFNTVLQTDPEVEFSQASYQVREDGTASGNVVTLTRTGDVSQNAFLSVAAAGNTAQAGPAGQLNSDFDSAKVPIKVAFKAGETQVTVDIPVLDDILIESTEDLTITVSAEVGATIGSQATATVEIIDNDLVGIPVAAEEPAYTNGTQNTVSWSQTQGAVSYVAECHDSQNFDSLLEQGEVDEPTREYTFSGLSENETYYYRVRAVEEGGGESGWSDAVSSVQNATSLSLSQSGSGTLSVDLNDSASFEVTASGVTLSASYQWYFGNTAVGGDSAQFTIDEVLLTDAGLYYCEATDDAGDMAESASFTLNVRSPFEGEQTAEGAIEGESEADCLASAAYTAATPISDLRGISLPLTFDAGGAAGRLSVEVNIIHTRVSDLELELVAPNGGKVRLVSRVNSTGQNFTGTVFEDGATKALTDGSAPFTGVFAPEERLAAVSRSSIDGQWSLVIEDLVQGNTGLLKDWQLCLKTGSVEGELLEGEGSEAETSDEGEAEGEAGPSNPLAAIGIDLLDAPGLDTGLDYEGAQEAIADITTSQFNQLDGNGDGALGERELQAAVLLLEFAAIDADSNNALSLAEAQSLIPGLDNQDLQSLGAGANGLLSESDLKSAFSSAAEGEPQSEDGESTASDGEPPTTAPPANPGNNNPDDSCGCAKSATTVGDLKDYLADLLMVGLSLLILAATAWARRR